MLCMSRFIDKFVEYFSLIDWASRNRLIELREKLIDHNTYLSESVLDLPLEFQNLEEKEIQQGVIRAILEVIEDILRFGNE